MADLNFALRRRKRERQRQVFRLDLLKLQQRQHPRRVGGYDLGDVALLARHGDEDVGRLVGEVERAGNDVAVRRDDQAGRRADAFA